MAYAEKYVTQAASGGDGNDNVGLSLSNATYDHTGGANERQLTSTGAFSGYTHAAGDVIWLTNAAGGIVVPAQYAIAARIDNNIITLSANAGLTGDSTADVDSTGGPWTLAEAFTNAVGGQRVNVQSDSGYAIGADTIDGAGTIASLIAFRGYNTLIGDLEGQGWNSDGTLDVTNYPVITCSGLIDFSTGNRFALVQNLFFTGGLNSSILGNGQGDKVYVVECKVTNTASGSNTSARACYLDNQCVALNCDFEITQATAHTNTIRGDSNFVMAGCRVKGGSEDGEVLCSINSGGSAINCTFIGRSGNGHGILAANASLVSIIGCTFYNLQTAIQFSNSAPTNYAHVIMNNHATDCTAYIDALYSASGNSAKLEVNNRTRDNDTDRTGIGDGAVVGEVTTDTGGSSTDYAGAGSDPEDLHLIDAAPGQGTGTRALDIGAYKAADPAGGGGGGKQAGSGGGQVG